jgi:hypothetical protein
MKGRWRIISKGLKNKLMQKGKDANIYKILNLLIQYSALEYMIKKGEI